MRRLVAAAAAVAVASGCGEAAPGGPGRLVVAAAASLAAPLTACSRHVPGADVRLSVGGSDALAAQIRQGVRPDVFAAADAALPARLAEEGLLRRPVRFATNALVLAVPVDGRVASLRDLARPGVRLVVGSPSVPVGAYAREALARLPPVRARAILANVRSSEPDVAGVVGKLTQGAADAGFVYRTDVADGLEAIELPRALQPRIAYAAGVVAGTGRERLAASYVEGLVSGPCAHAHRAAGFGPAPPR